MSLPTVFQLKMWKSIAYILLGINNGHKTSYETNFCVEEFNILLFPLQNVTKDNHKKACHICYVQMILEHDNASYTGRII